LTRPVSPDRRAAIRFIVCLGLVSLFADMTYEGAYSSVGSLLEGLGAGAAVVGLVSGLGEMIAASLRYFSGRLADRTHAYWTFVIIGYVLNLIAIPGLAFVTTWEWAAVLIVIERTGKAIRGPARDVLLSEATGVVGHGWGFGLHAVMDQTGAVVGPLIMAAVVARTHSFAYAFMLLSVPAVLALASILLARYFRPNKGTPLPVKAPQTLTRTFWLYVIAAGLLACGFFDFPVLNYHFQHAQLFRPEMIPFLYAIAMGVTGLTALICGRLFDRFGLSVLIIGILITMLSLPLGFLGGPLGGVLAVIAWGAGHCVQDATLRSGIAQVVSMNKRGTAFGAFNGVYGVMWFAGSAVMGLLYNYSLVALVAFGLTAQVAAAVLFFSLRHRMVAEAH
jgi:MFS family permease